ncbi:hypothetical protein KSP40_PGU009909 [Platanthera guangdongensis]|uniref:Secreted protein n=1 Tax=Platanthera guangdongensis TaxID=2320717 RepID=A0ABR2LQN5_9ASPA
MRATKLGLLCRSQAATAVCAPGDIHAAVVVPRRPDRSNSEHSKLLDPKHARLADHRHRIACTASAAECHRRRLQAVTLPMVTKRGIDPPEPKTCLPVTASFTPTNQNELFQVVVMRVSIHCQGCAGKSISKVKKAEFWSSC